MTGPDGRPTTSRLGSVSPNVDPHKETMLVVEPFGGAARNHRSQPPAKPTIIGPEAPMMPESPAVRPSRRPPALPSTRRKDPPESANTLVAQTSPFDESDADPAKPARPTAGTPAVPKPQRQ
jgi:hypothetical protein